MYKIHKEISTYLGLSHSARPKKLYFESLLDIVHSPKLFIISYKYLQVFFYLSFLFFLFFLFVVFFFFSFHHMNDIFETSRNVVDFLK